MLAFLFPHQHERQGELNDFLVPVDTIEALTGLDFFASMDESKQKELEKTNTFKFWDSF